MVNSEKVVKNPKHVGNVFPTRSVALAFGRLAGVIADLTYPAIEARFKKTRSLLGVSQWAKNSGSSFSVTSTVISSATGDNAYVTALTMGKGIAFNEANVHQKLMWSEGGPLGWRCYSQCECAFFLESHSDGVCKHVGALVLSVGEFACAHAEALLIEAAISIKKPLGCDQNNQDQRAIIKIKSRL